MNETREYIVTLKDMADTEEFYLDMETSGGNLYIPDREVELTQRRALSRNTHYMLTDEEAETVRQDPRVLAVELLPSELGFRVRPDWVQTGDFEKSVSIGSTDKNWGLLRVTAGSNLANWGTNGAYTQATATVKTQYSGKNVDVVVVDSHINMNHPEFAANPDGTGGSRAIPLDWFTYSNIVGVTTSGSYDYSNISSNHGTHVAGTVAGNTQGWARDANIYNMEFNYMGANKPTGDWPLYIFDYLRAFHKNKPINPITGRRNPTVTNHSWGYSYGDILLSNVTSVTYRGVTTAVSGTNAQKKTTLEENGVPVPLGSYLYRMPASYAALDADIVDAMKDGIIVVSSAGNSYWNIAVPGSVDYNNSLIASGSTYYHSRGSSPARATGVICVGAIDTATQEYKTNFSNYGSRVDIWAPGRFIASAVHDSTAATEFSITLANDPRNSTYKLGSISGTSMSGPQVAGYVASIIEEYQNLTQAEALAYIIQHSTKSQIGTTGNINRSPYQALGDSSLNRYLFYFKERQEGGQVYPPVTQKARPTSGAVFPRPRIRK